MNIKRAKQEIKDTIEAYLLKDERENTVFLLSDKDLCF